MTFEQLVNVAQLLTIGIIPLLITLHNLNKTRWDEVFRKLHDQDMQRQEIMAALEKHDKRTRKTSKRLKALEVQLMTGYIGRVRKRQLPQPKGSPT